MNTHHTVIIGGTRGLGKAVTRKLAKEGRRITILARSIPENNDYPDHDVVFIKADLTQELEFLATLANVLEERGKINHLIFLQRFKGEGDRWQGELDVSLNMTRKVIETFKHNFIVDDKTESSITLVSSIMGRLANNSQPLSYSIAKAGLNHFVRYYAAELGPLGIRINAVSPITFIKEESKKFYLEEKKEINALYQEIVPLKRMCTIEDVANVIYFLASPLSAFISGQNIDVDGGLSVVSHETMARNLKGI